MHSTEFQCPECRTLLRVRDPDVQRVGFDCPECGTPIPAPEPDSAPPLEPPPPSPNEVDADAILAAAPSADGPSRLDELDAVPREPTLEPRTASSVTTIAERLRSPVAIAWLTAVLATLVVGVVLFLPDSTPVDADDDLPGKTASGPDEPVEEPVPDPQPAAETGGHFERLGRRLLAYRTRNGGLPADADDDLNGTGTPLSWIARLEAFDALGGLAPPVWDRPYDDLRNADFVRRERPEFLNPTIPRTRSPNMEPVTHFVGVGGLGADAPQLPGDHPRAGMFGAGRSARPEDVTDGLSNTMMIAGVRSELGSWAAAGPGTVRPFVTEPYVNGPDGFGTGAADGMLVLMGDGSVRTVGVGADPRIVRRMAAANDGLDLDLELPGEPGDPTVPPDGPVVARVDPPLPDGPENPPRPGARPDPMPPVEPVPPENADPVEPLLPFPKLPAWNAELVAEKLAQPLAGFRTSRPIAAELLLDEVAEMCGVPIHARKEEGVDLAVFEKPVSLTVEKGTVGSVLDALLAKLELRYVVADDGLHLEPLAARDRAGRPMQTTDVKPAPAPPEQP